MISTATSGSPPSAPSRQQQQRRRVVRFRPLTTIDDVGHDASATADNKADDSLLPFGIKRVEVGPTKVDVVAFAGNDSSSNASGLLSLALGQASRGSAGGTPSRRVRTSLGRLSSELLSEEKLGATPPFATLTATGAAAAPTPPRKSNPIPIGASSSLSPSRPSSAAIKPAATAGKEQQQQRRNLEKNGENTDKAFDATGSWTQRVTFYPVVVAAPAPIAPAPSTPVKDVAVVPQLSSSQGSDSSSSGSGNETDDGTSASPKSVFEVRAGRKQQQKENSKPIAGAPIPVVIAAAPKKDSNNDGGWRLRFRRRWRRERLYAAIGVFPRSPPKDYFDDFNNRAPGADALSAAVAGAFDEADVSVAFGDGEW